MKRPGSLACAAMAVGVIGVVVGCNQNKKKDDTADAAKKYHILSGDTSDASARQSRSDFDRNPEPAFNAETHFAAGQMAEAQGQPQGAVAQYEQALRLNPRHIPTLYRMGVMLTRMQKYDQAVAMWQRYVKATGNLPSAYSNLGFCYEMAGDAANAEKAYKAGLAINDRDESCRVHYGLLLARQHREDQARQVLGGVLSPAEVSYNLGLIYEQQGALARAREEMRNALAEDPSLTEAQTRLATLPKE